MERVGVRREGMLKTAKFLPRLGGAATRRVKAHLKLTVRLAPR